MIARKKPTARPVEKTKTRQAAAKAAPPAKVKAASSPAAGLTVEIPVESIDAQPFNPRTEFDQAELGQLTASLKEHGLLQPIIVRKGKDGRYELIAGERRLRAATAAGWTKIPATIRNATDEDALVWAMVENIERADLNPVDRARGVARLCAPKSEGGCGMSLADAGEMMGRDTSWVRFQIQMLRLPEVWLQRIASGEINVSMSKSLLPYAERPAVLAKIEDDMLANPWAWRTGDDFDRNAKLLADEPARQPAVPSPLEPMRASPGEATNPDSLRRRQYPKQAAASTRVEAEAVAATNAEDPHAAAAVHAGGDVEGLDRKSAPRVDVLQIIEVIGRIDDISELMEIMGAADRRMTELAGLDSAPTKG